MTVEAPSFGSVEARLVPWLAPVKLYLSAVWQGNPTGECDGMLGFGTGLSRQRTAIIRGRNT